MLDELDRLPEVGAAMHAGEKPLDNLAGQDLQPRDTRDDVGRKSFRRGLSHREEPRGAEVDDIHMFPDQSGSVQPE